MSGPRNPSTPTSDELAQAGEATTKLLKTGTLTPSMTQRLTALNQGVRQALAGKQAEHRATTAQSSASSSATYPSNIPTATPNTQMRSSEPQAASSSITAPQTTNPSLTIDVSPEENREEMVINPSASANDDMGEDVVIISADRTPSLKLDPSAEQPSAPENDANPDNTQNPAPFTASIQADTTPSQENDNDADANDQSTSENDATLNVDKDYIEKYELTGDEKRHLVKNIDSYEMRTEYFLSLARQRDASARAREFYETNQAINFIKTLQRKVNALRKDSDLAANMPEKIEKILAMCREILSRMNKTNSPQTKILSYGIKAPQIFSTYEEAERSIAGYKDTEDPKKSIAGYFTGSTETNEVNSISKSTNPSIYNTSPLPTTREYTACYYEVQTSQGAAKAASIQYEDPNTQQFRANLLFDLDTVDLIANDSGKPIPNASIMNWAKGVISTFIADPRGAAGELKLNCPTMPLICMKALVLHAKMQGILISKFSNFSGLMKLGDITDKHVRLYEKQIEAHRDQSAEAPLKEVNQYSINDLKDLEKKTNPEPLPRKERAKAIWHKLSRGWRDQDIHANDPLVTPAKYMPKVAVDAEKPADKSEANKNKP